LLQKLSQHPLLVSAAIFLGAIPSAQENQHTSSFITIKRSGSADLTKMLENVWHARKASRMQVAKGVLPPVHPAQEISRPVHADAEDR
jgi:hypothetical protein